MIKNKATIRSEKHKCIYCFKKLTKGNDYEYSEVWIYQLRRKFRVYFCRQCSIKLF